MALLNVVFDVVIAFMGPGVQHLAHVAIRGRRVSAVVGVRGGVHGGVRASAGERVLS